MGGIYPQDLRSQHPHRRECRYGRNPVDHWVFAEAANLTAIGEHAGVIRTCIYHDDISKNS